MQGLRRTSGINPRKLHYLAGKRPTIHPWNCYCICSLILLFRISGTATVICSFTMKCFPLFVPGPYSWIHELGSSCVNALLNILVKSRLPEEINYGKHTCKHCRMQSKRRRRKINLHRSACQSSPLYLAAGRAGGRLWLSPNRTQESDIKFIESYFEMRNI